MLKYTHLGDYQYEDIPRFHQVIVSNLKKKLNLDFL